MGNKINVVFHNIVEKESEVNNHYEVTVDFLCEIVESLLKILENKEVNLIVFLDDGYFSQAKYAKLLHENYGIEICISLISQNIGIDGYLDQMEIKTLYNYNGVSMASHGVSHAALGKYENGEILPTLPNGQYRNMRRGHAERLAVEEVRYQLKESKSQLAKNKIQTEIFVYPYGIFNDEITNLIQKEKIYSRAYTCEEGLETEKTLPLAIPRILVDNTQSVDEVCLKVARFIEDLV